MQALRARLIEMRAKAAWTEAALDAIGRSADQRIGAGAIGGRHNDQAGARRSGKLAEIGWRHGGHIDRDQQNRRRPHFHGPQTRRVGGSAVADLLVFFKDQRA